MRTECFFITPNGDVYTIEVIAEDNGEGYCTDYTGRAFKSMRQVGGEVMTQERNRTIKWLVEQILEAESPTPRP